MRTGTAVLVGLLAVALAMTACGAKPAGHPVATAGGTLTPSASATRNDDLSDQQRALRYARCMRENGVPDFPDPTFNGKGGVGISLPDGADRAKVDAANEKCKQYLPNGGQAPTIDPTMIAQLRTFARCMREHGLPNFPDPTGSGLQVNGNEPGMSPDDPTFKAAQAACAKFQPSPPPGSGGGGLTTGHNG